MDNFFYVSIKGLIVLDIVYLFGDNSERVFLWRTTPVVRLF